MDLMDFSKYNKITEHKNEYTEEDIIRVIKSGGMVYTDSIHNLSVHDDDEPVQPIDIIDGNVIVLVNGQNYNTHLHSIYKLKENYTYNFEGDRDEYSQFNQGFNNDNEAREELDYLLDDKYKNLPDQINLYRMLFIEEGQKIDIDTIGDHWIMDSDLMLDDEFIQKIRETSHAHWEEPVIIEALFNTSEIDWEGTLDNNMNFPREFEITTNTEPLNLNVHTLEEFREKHSDSN